MKERLCEVGNEKTKALQRSVGKASWWKVTIPDLLLKYFLNHPTTRYFHSSHLITLHCSSSLTHLNLYLLPQVSVPHLFQNSDLNSSENHQQPYNINSGQSSPIVYLHTPSSPTLLQGPILWKDDQRITTLTLPTPKDSSLRVPRKTSKLLALLVSFLVFQHNTAQFSLGSTVWM